MNKTIEHKPGYKWTKVGWIPKDWDAVKGRSIFTKRTAKGFNDLKIYSVTLNDGLVPRDSLNRKMGNDVLPEKSLLIEPGDIAYNMMRMWQGAFGLSNYSGIVSPAYVVLRCKGHADPEYYSILMKSYMFLYFLKAYSYGITSDRLRLYFQDFCMITFPLPPLPEQKKIAQILSTWDRAIDKLRELIAAKERRKKGLMQVLLTGKVRFEGFEEEWVKVRLGEFANVRRGASPRPIKDPKFFSDSGRGWIRISDVTSSKMYINEASQYLSELGARKSVEVNSGDFIMSIMRNDWSA